MRRFGLGGKGRAVSSWLGGGLAARNIRERRGAAPLWRRNGIVRPGCGRGGEEYG